MSDYAYYNGVYTPYDSAVIPLSDRSIFFGDAVYDVMIGRNGKVYQLHEHLKRLRLNAERISLNMCESDEDIREIIDVLIAESKHREFIIYVQLSGHSERRIHKNDTAKYNLLITLTSATHPWAPAVIQAITLQDKRYDYCDVKTTNLLPAILSLRESERCGADIAIFHRNRIITECSHANIAILARGEIITPPLNSSILPGITRRNMISVCERIGISVCERNITLDDLCSADSVWVTSTTHFLRVCSHVDHMPIKKFKSDLTKEIFDLLYYDFLCNTTS